MSDKKSTKKIKRQRLALIGQLIPYIPDILRFVQFSLVIVLASALVWVGVYNTQVWLFVVAAIEVTAHDTH